MKNTEYNFLRSDLCLISLQSISEKCPGVPGLFEGAHDATFRHRLVAQVVELVQHSHGRILDAHRPAPAMGIVFGLGLKSKQKQKQKCHISTFWDFAAAVNYFVHYFSLEWRRSAHLKVHRVLDDGEGALLGQVGIGGADGGRAAVQVLRGDENVRHSTGGVEVAASEIPGREEGWGAAQVVTSKGRRGRSVQGVRRGRGVRRGGARTGGGVSAWGQTAGANAAAAANFATVIGARAGRRGGQLGGQHWRPKGIFGEVLIAGIDGEFAD